MARPSNRERLLDSFEVLLSTRGASEATLDAIAADAGVSKGGLTYHFSSKAALLEAFGDRLLGRIDEMVAEVPPEPRAVIEWYLTYQSSDPAEEAMWRSLLAGMHGANEGLRAVVNEAFVRYAAPLSVLDPELADHVRLLGDGLFLNALLGQPLPPAPHLERLVDELAARADQSGRTPTPTTSPDASSS